jgi:hypothetical protein
LSGRQPRQGVANLDRLGDCRSRKGGPRCHHGRTDGGSFEKPTARQFIQIYVGTLLQLDHRTDCREVVGYETARRRARLIEDVQISPYHASRMPASVAAYLVGATTARHSPPFPRVERCAARPLIGVARLKFYPQHSGHCTRQVPTSSLAVSHLFLRPKVRPGSADRFDRFGLRACARTQEFLAVATACVILPLRRAHDLVAGGANSPCKCTSRIWSKDAASDDAPCGS